MMDKIYQATYLLWKISYPMCKFLPGLVTHYYFMLICMLRNVSKQSLPNKRNHWQLKGGENFMILKPEKVLKSDLIILMQFDPFLSVVSTYVSNFSNRTNVR